MVVPLLGGNFAFSSERDADPDDLIKTPSETHLRHFVYVDILGIVGRPFAAVKESLSGVISIFEGFNLDTYEAALVQAFIRCLGITLDLDKGEMFVAFGRS